MSNLDFVSRYVSIVHPHFGSNEKTLLLLTSNIIYAAIFAVGNTGDIPSHFESLP